MAKELKVCEVCKLLDNDYTAKECSYCKICSSWICNSDLYNYKRRAKALAYDKVMRLHAAFTGILIISMLGCILARDYSKVSNPVKAVSPSPIVYSARTDKNITQLPSPLPTWGAIGLCKTYTNPAYPGSTYVRVTDSTLNNKSSLLTADSGDPQLGSFDGLHFIVRASGGTSFIVAFNPATLTCAYTPIKLQYDAVEFSDKTNTIYALHGTEIHALQVSTTWTNITSDNAIFDYAACLGITFKPTWIGAFTVALDDTTFKTAYSNTGSQGSGTYIVVWNKALGCSVYNTLTGVVSNNNVLLGTVNIPDRFYLHEAGEGLDPKYALVTATNKTDKGNPGCTSAPAVKCLVDEPYVWQAFTLNVAKCNKNCDGHSAKGINGFYTGKQQRYHSYVNPAFPLTPMVSLPAGEPDEHGSYHNQTLNNTQPSVPLFLSVAATPALKVFPVWGYDELLGIPTDGSGIVYRFGQTMNSGKSKYFICQNAIAVSDQIGNMYFTSDMGGNGALGYESDGKTSRCDVFALVIK
jgi:hypothetical protein